MLSRWHHSRTHRLLVVQGEYLLWNFIGWEFHWITLQLELKLSLHAHGQPIVVTGAAVDFSLSLSLRSDARFCEEVFQSALRLLRFVVLRADLCLVNLLLVREPRTIREDLRCVLLRYFDRVQRFHGFFSCSFFRNFKLLHCLISFLVGNGLICHFDNRLLTLQRVVIATKPANADISGASKVSSRLLQNFCSLCFVWARPTIVDLGT